LRQLGHEGARRTGYASESWDVLVALHAVRSAASVSRFHRLHPERPIVVALTGTDVYGKRAKMLASLALAEAVVLLQPLARRELPARHRRKARVILQSAIATVPEGTFPEYNEGMPKARPTPRGRSSRSQFLVAVVAHLRGVKDPFRAARAVRDLPESSRIQVIHAGRALTPAMRRAARAEEKRNPRYRWLGEVPQARARGLIAGSRVLVLSSLAEGGANVIGEACATGTPVLASRIPGTVGLLGARYGGYFAVRDTRGLRRLLLRCESEPAFLAKLERQCAALAKRFAPEIERSAWKKLLSELALIEGSSASRGGSARGSKRAGDPRRGAVVPARVQTRSQKRGRR
jgi:putative glycosyltransferase (TIGR04348 family)